MLAVATQDWFCVQQVLTCNSRAPALSVMDGRFLAIVQCFVRSYNVLYRMCTCSMLQVQICVPFK